MIEFDISSFPDSLGLYEMATLQWNNEGPDSGDTSENTNEIHTFTMCYLCHRISAPTGLTLETGKSTTI